MSPSWDEPGMPWLKFKASLSELVHESLVLHVTHSGKLKNTTLGRCNLLFRTLVDSGKSFKEDDLISFKGPLNKKDTSCSIEGRLVFKHLPYFAQMKPVTGGRPSVHTEKGILDSMPLLSWVPRPNMPVIMSDTPSAEVGTPKTARKSMSRLRSNTNIDDISLPSRTSRSNLFESTNRSNLFESTNSLAQSSVDSISQSKKSEVVTADLIAFTPPNQRKRAVSHTPFMVSSVFESDAPLVAQSTMPPNPFTQTGYTINPMMTQQYPQMSPNPFAPSPLGQPNPFASQFAFQPQPQPPQPQPQQVPSVTTEQPSFNPFG